MPMTVGITFIFNNSRKSELGQSTCLTPQNSG